MTSQWWGFAVATVPAPHPLIWGASPPLPDALDLACQAAGAHAMTMALETDPADPPARALAALGRAIIGRNP